jgi:hypothetical protein
MDIHAPVRFLKPDPIYDEEKPYYILARPPPEMQRSNINYVSFTTKVHDVRDQMKSFSLLDEGFEWINHQLTFDVNDESSIDRYVTEMETVVKKHLGAKRVHVYDYVVIPKANLAQ